MSTSDKLTYLNGTKQALKESINNLGGDITSETTFREYAQELDNIYDNLPKTTGEDTNLSLTTLKGKMNIIPKGDTKQTQYSGYNKMNTANATIGYKPEGTTITIDSKGVINASTDMGYVSINLPSMTLSSGTTYTFKRNFTGSYNSSLVDTNGETIVAIGYNKTSVTLTPESDITINKLNGALVSGDDYFWLYEGTTDKSFEPYVGGTASPNPTYPQNIEVVTGTQEVKVENVNLLDVSSITTPITKNGITLTPKGNGTFELKGIATTANAGFVLGKYKFTNGTNYTMSNGLGDNAYGKYTMLMPTYAAWGNNTIIMGTSATFQAKSSEEFNIEMVVYNGTDISSGITIQPQLEKRKYCYNLYTTPRTNTSSRII